MEWWYLKQLCKLPAIPTGDEIWKGKQIAAQGVSSELYSTLLILCCRHFCVLEAAIVYLPTSSSPLHVWMDAERTFFNQKRDSDSLWRFKRYSLPWLQGTVVILCVGELVKTSTKNALFLSCDGNDLAEITGEEKSFCLNLLSDFFISLLGCLFVPSCFPKLFLLLIRFISSLSRCMFCPLCTPPAFFS